MKRMKNPNLDSGNRVIEVPDSAVPIYAQSGWQELSKKDSAALDQQVFDAARAAEKAMADVAGATLPPENTESDKKESS